MLTFILSLIFTCCCGLDIIYRFVTDVKHTYMDFVTWIVILALIYYIDQLVTTASYMRAPPGTKETLISNDKPRTIRDSIYKYLTAWVIGVLFIFELISLMNTGFSKYKAKDSTKTGEKFLKYLDGIYTAFVLPCALILDACLTKRRRCPSFSCDMFVLCGVLVVFVVVDILFWSKTSGAENIFKKIANLFIECIFTFDGYIFMDWLLFKFNGTGGNYALFQ